MFDNFAARRAPVVVIVVAVVTGFGCLDDPVTAAGLADTAVVYARFAAAVAWRDSTCRGATICFVVITIVALLVAALDAIAAIGCALAGNRLISVRLFTGPSDTDGAVLGAAIIAFVRVPVVT